MPNTKPMPLFEEHDYTAIEWLAAQRLHLLRTLLSLAHPLWQRVEESTGVLATPLASNTYRPTLIEIDGLASADENLDTSTKFARAEHRDCIKPVHQ